MGRIALGKIAIWQCVLAWARQAGQRPQAQSYVPVIMSKLKRYHVAHVSVTSVVRNVSIELSGYAYAPATRDKNCS